MNIYHWVVRGTEFYYVKTSTGQIMDRLEYVHHTGYIYGDDCAVTCELGQYITLEAAKKAVEEYYK